MDLNKEYLTRRMTLQNLNEGTLIVLEKVSLKQFTINERSLGKNKPQFYLSEVYNQKYFCPSNPETRVQISKGTMPSKMKHFKLVFLEPVESLF